MKIFIIRFVVGLMIVYLGSLLSEKVTIPEGQFLIGLMTMLVYFAAWDLIGKQFSPTPNTEFFSRSKEPYIPRKGDIIQYVGHRFSNLKTGETYEITEITKGERGDVVELIRDGVKYSHFNVAFFSDDNAEGYAQFAWTGIYIIQ